MKEISNSINKYMDSCQKLIQENPYQEWFFEYNNISEEAGTQLEVKNTTNIEEFYNSKPATYVPRVFRCENYKMYNYEVVRRLIGGQDLIAYVLPKPHPKIKKKNPSLFIQSLPNEERRMEVFNELEKQYELEYQQYITDLENKAKESFIFEFSARFPGEKTKLFEFLLSGGSIYVEKIDDNLYFMTENGIILCDVNNEIVEEAYEQGQVLYGIKEYVRVQTWSESIYFKISNDYELIEPYLRKKEDIFKLSFLGSMNPHKRYSSVWTPPSYNDLEEYDLVKYQRDNISLFNRAVSYLIFKGEDEFTEGERLYLDWTTVKANGMKNNHLEEYVIYLYKENGRRVGTVLGSYKLKIVIAYALYCKRSYEAHVFSFLYFDQKDYRISIIFS